MSFKWQGHVPRTRIDSRGKYDAKYDAKYDEVWTNVQPRESLVILVAK